MNEGNDSMSIRKEVKIGKSKPYRILSIDGGGILGLYSAIILENIKKDFLRNVDFCKYFHLITGTSTGGIIAMGLGINKDIKEIVKFYEVHGDEIFPYKSRLVHSLMAIKILFSNKYRHEKIKRIATEFYNNKTMSDSLCALCIPAIDVSNCQPIVFKTQNSKNLTRDNHALMRDVALATSAAPTYFPIYSFGNYKGLVDGGLWQNNPSLIGVLEACKYFVGNDKEYDCIELLSIGNPHSNLKKTISLKNMRSSLTKWKSNLIEIPMKITSFATDQIMNFLLDDNSLYINKYVRVASNNIPVEHHKLSLDFASRDALKAIAELANHDYNHNKKKLISFFGGV